MSVLSVPEPRKREFLPTEFKVTVWSRLKPYYNALLQRPIDSLATLERWIFDWNELNALIREEINWRYIRFTSDTRDVRASEAYTYIIQEIHPKAKAIDQLLIEKLFDTSFHTQLSKDRFALFLRNMQNSLELYTEENIPILAKIKTRSKEYGKLLSQINVAIEGVDYNFQQANLFLASENRKVREEAFRAIHFQLENNSDSLDHLFDDLLEQRQQVAINAGFENYRDYQFKALRRFDYNTEDCSVFHESIKKEILPVLEKLYKIRQKSLKVESLKPWDLKADILGQKPLKPFVDTDELVKKAVECLSEIDPFFGECLEVMNKIGHLDLNARAAKRPGAYNMPLPLSGIPFVFMNATQSIKDVAILAHESGHAVHAFYLKDFRLNSSKNPPSEVTELAAMSMEMFMMENQDTFFPDESDKKRARLQQLERVLYSLCWIACVDKFQHWVYTHPQHNRAKREEQWLKFFYEFMPSNLDYNDLEGLAALQWKKQLHIFEHPFYYIEYGFALLGAVALWKQYLENPSKTIQNFKKALQLGYTKTVPDIYEAAGIRFNFSEEYIRTLATRIQQDFEQCVFEL